MSELVTEQQGLAKTTYADLLVTYLHELGIQYVFGVPGGAIEPLYDAMARSAARGGPRAVIARHESGAAFMAEGYFQESGKMGVVCSTTGPGATNLITGVSSAYSENTPMLVITAQTALPKFGKQALQDSSCTAVDTVGMFRHCTCFNTLVSHPDQFENKLISAIMAAHRVPHGPAHISVPSDVLSAVTRTIPTIRSEMLRQNYVLSNEAAIQRLSQALKEARSVAFYLGNGVGKASSAIMEIVEALRAPFVAGPMGKRWVDEWHPLYCGVYGFGGHASAHAVLRGDLRGDGRGEPPDLILAVGAVLGELDTGGWHDDLLNERLVHIDSSVEHFTRSPMARLHVCGDVERIFERLAGQVAQRAPPSAQSMKIRKSLNVMGNRVTLDDPDACLSDASPIKPQRLMYHLSKHLSEDTRIFIDAGNAWAWATHYLMRADVTGCYRIAMGYGAMTWAIGASVGSARANPGHPTVCVTGDGSYLMSAQELTVAAQEDLPVIVLILNDSALGMVYHGQRLGGAETIGWELNTVNYAAVAEAMGIEGIVIESPAQLMEIDFARLGRKSGPTLLDVRIDREEVPPMGDRVKELQTQRSSTGRKPASTAEEEQL
ncbi:MAG: thiamine pyrophosphate-binding protein [Natronospirillum sp.]